MKFDKDILTGVEKYIFTLKSLYGKYGYGQYRMSKFEEYALYGRNIEFLVSDRVITFTDTDGKLMALKPDVTLSIVKNDRDDVKSVRKVCYNENVYRVSKGTGAFREIAQSGIECIGNVDACLVGEVLSLAAKSLAATGKEYVLELSHLGILMSVIRGITSDADKTEKILKCVGDKNLHGVQEAAQGADTTLLKSLMSIYGNAADVIEKLRALPLDGDGKKSLDELELAVSALEGTKFESSLRIDFSVTADINYYNGIIFKGFVEGAPESALSGGQYDNLMKKLGRRSRAIGFALYIDVLERLFGDVPEYDADVMLIYQEGTSPKALREAADRLAAEGKSVFCCSAPNEKVKCRETLTI